MNYNYADQEFGSYQGIDDRDGDDKSELIKLFVSNPRYLFLLRSQSNYCRRKTTTKKNYDQEAKRTAATKE